MYTHCYYYQFFFVYQELILERISSPVWCMHCLSNYHDKEICKIILQIIIITYMTLYNMQTILNQTIAVGILNSWTN